IRPRVGTAPASPDPGEAGVFACRSHERRGAGRPLARDLVRNPRARRPGYWQGETTMNQRQADQSRGFGLMTGLFRDRDSAEAAYSALLARGYAPGDVHLAMSEETREKH